MVDPTRRLMEDADERKTETARCDGRTRERRCDRVQKDGARVELLGPAENCCPAKSGERERPLGK
jgi:hypothetical protein